MTRLEGIDHQAVIIFYASRVKILRKWYLLSKT